MTAINFEAPITITGDLTVESLDKTGFRVWMGSHVGTVQSGRYEGTGIITAGTGLCLYVKRDGKSVGTMRIDLGSLIAQAVDIFEDREQAALR